MRDFGGLPFIDYSARFEQDQPNPLEALALGQKIATGREANELEQLKLLAQRQKDLHTQEVVQRVVSNPRDPNSRAMLASLSPQAHEAVIKDLDYRGNQANQLLGAFKKAPAAQKPELYQHILPVLNQLLGEDAKYLPQEYGTNAEDAVNYYFDQTRSTTDAIKDEKAKLEQQEIMARTDTQRAHANLYNQQALGEQEKRKTDKLQSKAPSGYQYLETGELQPIPGGPIDLKQQAEFENDTLARETLQSNKAETLSLMDQLEKAPGLSGILGFKGAFPNFPGSDAANAQALYDTLISRNFINQVSTLKSLSKTGSTGLGALSNKEGDKLQNAVEALQRSQNDKQFLARLQNLKKVIKESDAIFDKAYRNKHKRFLAAEEEQPNKVASTSNSAIDYKNKYGLD